MKHAPTQPIAKLALEDGTVFSGVGFGAVDRPRPVSGEVVFNTGMSGYQEILTDPSYAGQIVVMTYPHIGNYGVNLEDAESAEVRAAGLVVRELAPRPSNYRSTARLEDWLAERGVAGIAGIDTRALTRRLRTGGAMRGVIGVGEADSAALVEAARGSASMSGRNLAAEVSPTRVRPWSDGLSREWMIGGSASDPAPAPANRGGGPGESERLTPAGPVRRRVVALDCGAKSNILRHLVDQGCEVIVVPHDTPAEAIREHEPDGLFISNGPGDPAPVRETIQTLSALRGETPTFGICLGHQLLGLAMGAETFKLRFGHHGVNQPVRNLATGKVEITSQNHGFAVEPGSLERAGATATHLNLNDRTLEGFRHRDLPLFAVQYHPEAAPGPHDAAYLFDCFIEMMSTGRSPTAEHMDAAQRRRNARVGS